MKWKPFGFNQVRLRVPEAWDLMKHFGDCRRGDFVMDDGEQAVLDAQWGPWPSHDIIALEDKLIARARGAQIERRHDLAPDRRALQVRMPTGPLVMVLAVERPLSRYVLLRLLHPPADPLPFVREMAEALGQEQPDAPQAWRFFATAFRLPPAFFLREAALKVGCMRLDFHRRGRQLRLWDFSLLDRLEGRTDTATFAYDLVASEYTKRFAFPRAQERRGADAAEFVATGGMRTRWIVNPLQWYNNRRARLEFVANRRRNRFSVILFTHRHEDDCGWLQGLTESLRRPEDVCSVDWDA